MKCHYNVSVLSAEHRWRSALHGESDAETGHRLLRMTLDLNCVRSIHPALTDGIKTGEVPCGSFGPVQPGVLVAGKDPVASDAVSAAAMGFDPTAEPPIAPFLHGDDGSPPGHDPPPYSRQSRPYGPTLLG